MVGKWNWNLYLLSLPGTMPKFSGQTVIMRVWAGGVVVHGKVAPAARGASDGACENDVRVVGMNGDMAAFRGPGNVAVFPQDGFFIGAAGNAHGGVVHLSGVDAVGVLGVGGEVEEAGGGLIVEGGPRTPTVES